MANGQLSPLGWITLLLSGLIVGGTLGWWLHRETPPWIGFEDPAATYTPHDGILSINETYWVNRECRSGADWHYIVVLWDADLKVFPPHNAHDIELGEHHHVTAIQWPEDVQPPHGAIVRVLVMCFSETPELAVSPGMTVRFMDLRGLPAKPEDFVATRQRKKLLTP